MERLKAMKNTLMGCVEGQLGRLQETDTEELGQAIDMIKDLEEAMYYCSIVKAMEKAEKEEEMGRIQTRYYTPYNMMPMPVYDQMRDMDRDIGRMYYSERQPRNSQGEFMSYDDRRDSSSGRGGMGNTNYYTERMMPLELRD